MLFPLRSGTRRGYVLSSLQLNIALEVLVNAIRKNNKQNKHHLDGSEPVLIADNMIKNVEKSHGIEKKLLELMWV